ncbi:MAG: hypothetical protein R2701_02655 [Acidimicrobiales bacterium]
MYWGMVADQLDAARSTSLPRSASRRCSWGDRDHGGGMGKGVACLHELLPNHRFTSSRPSPPSKRSVDDLAEQILTGI